MKSANILAINRYKSNLCILEIFLIKKIASVIPGKKLYSRMKHARQSVIFLFKEYIVKPFDISWLYFELINSYLRVILMPQDMLSSCLLTRYIYLKIIVILANE